MCFKIKKFNRKKEKDTETHYTPSFYINAFEEMMSTWPHGKWEVKISNGAYIFYIENEQHFTELHNFLGPKLNKYTFKGQIIGFEKLE